MTETPATTDQQPTDSATQQTTAPETATPAPAAVEQPTAQTQQPETQPATTDEGTTDEVKPEAVVEYQDFKAPEDVQLDTELLAEFKEQAKALGLDQDKAQGVVDLGVKLQQKWQSEQTRAMDAAREQWANQSTADKEFGGTALNENLAVARKAMDTFGTPELKQLLNDSGLGNHPEIIRAFYRAGKTISDDRFVGGGNGPSGSTDPAKVMFPSMN